MNPIQDGTTHGGHKMVKKKLNFVMIQKAFLTRMHLARAYDANNRLLIHSLSKKIDGMQLFLIPI